jgi:DNA mismatch repair protein MutS2
MANKADKRYQVVGGTPKLGDLMRNKLNHQIGTLVEMKDKKHTIQIGNLPFQVQLDEWVVVRPKEAPTQAKKTSKKNN